MKKKPTKSVPLDHNSEVTNIKNRDELTPSFLKFLNLKYWASENVFFPET